MTEEMVDVSLMAVNDFDLNDILLKNGICLITWRYNQGEESMKRSVPAVALLTAAFIAGAAYVSDAQSAASDQAKSPDQIVMSSCTACHGIDRVCKNLGQDSAAWSKLVTGMVKKGARVDQQDIPRVADYLAGLKPGSKPVCK